MNKEENKEIKEQVKELKELLKIIEVDDSPTKEDVMHIHKQLNKFLKKIDKNEKLKQKLNISG